MSHTVDRFDIEQEDFLFILESKHKVNFSMDFHIHDFYEIAIVTGGSGGSQRLVDGEIIEIPIEQDTILFWDGTLPHRAVDSQGDPLSQVIIIFDRKYLSRMKGYEAVLDLLGQTNPIIIKSHLLNQKLKPSFRQILSEVRGKNIGRDMVILAKLSQIVVQLVRHQSSKEEYSDQMNDERIIRAVDFIHQNYFQNITLEEIAKISSLSVRQFSDLFKKETGSTLVKYVHRFRIQKAREFLKDEERTVTDIAFELGYDDVSYFIRRFKLVEGLTPYEFRKQTK